MAEKYGPFRKRLEEQRARLLQDIETSQETAPSRVTAGDEPRYSNHLADEGTTTYQQEANLALGRHMENELAAVEAALHRLREGTYGRCENCGRDIGLDRLEVLPSATLCITCKSRREAKR